MNNTPKLVIGFVLVVFVALVVVFLARTSAVIPESSTTATTTESTASSTPDWEQGMQVITQADMGTTIHLAANERFVIQLGSDRTWTLAFSPAGIISRVPNSTTAGGVQGVYEADAAGTTVLSATGAPICTAGEMCPQNVLLVKVTFVVATPDATGQHCGGFIQNAPTCPSGYHCQLNKIADTGGTCQPD